MRPALYRHIRMVIEIASNLPTLFVVIDFLLPTTIAKYIVIINLNLNIDAVSFITMLLVYLNCLGTCRRWWMLFQPPFATTGKQFVENMSSSTNKLITPYTIHSYVVSLFASFGHPPSMMDAVSANICNDGRAICRKYE